MLGEAVGALGTVSVVCGRKGSRAEREAERAQGIGNRDSHITLEATDSVYYISSCAIYIYIPYYCLPNEQSFKH